MNIQHFYYISNGFYVFILFNHRVNRKLHLSGMINATFFIEIHKKKRQLKFNIERNIFPLNFTTFVLIQKSLHFKKIKILNHD